MGRWAIGGFELEGNADEGFGASGLVLQELGEMAWEVEARACSY